MRDILSRIPLYKLFRRFGRPRILPLNLTVSLTYRCNSRCRTCNIYKKKAEELSAEEYDRIFSSIGTSPYWITFSGGEPFLRDDIVEVCRSAYENCRPRIINIPTNGILTDAIEERVKRILDHCTDASIIVNLSVDGIGPRHDDIRGVRGCYERAMETYSRLRRLRYPNFTLGIHTVISRFNAKAIPDIFNTLKELKPDSYITEIAEERVELGTVGEKITPEAEEYSRAVDFISREMKKWDMKNISQITRAFRTRYYETVKHFLNNGSMLLPCYAAVASCQITPDGNVWACCIKAEDMGSLKKTGYDFSRIWFSGRAEELRKEIRDRNCVCPLANAGYTNMLMSFKTMFSITGGLLHR